VKAWLGAAKRTAEGRCRLPSRTKKAQPLLFLFRNDTSHTHQPHRISISVDTLWRAFFLFFSCAFSPDSQSVATPAWRPAQDSRLRLRAHLLARSSRLPLGAFFKVQPPLLAVVAVANCSPREKFGGQRRTNWAVEVVAGGSRTLSVSGTRVHAACCSCPSVVIASYDTYSLSFSCARKRKSSIVRLTKEVSSRGSIWLRTCDNKANSYCPSRVSSQSP
jgi:hypothetical protein